jgi:hypothetical protein
MDLDIREQKLRQRIEEQGNTLCPTTFKELLANKFQRAQNFYIAHKKFDDQHSGIKKQRELGTHNKKFQMGGVQDDTYGENVGSKIGS